MLRNAPLTLLLVLLLGCAPQPELLEGRPGGPYRLTLSLDPAQPVAGEETILEFELTYSKTGQPVRDLQVAHERLIHNFVINLDFSSFAHIHHEDFYPLTESDRNNARLRYPYRFPSAGRYRVVSEFAHRNRSWTKNFDITVGAPSSVDSATISNNVANNVANNSADNLANDLIDEQDDYRARLMLDSGQPIVGAETALTLALERNGVPVTDLALYLGSEMHGAVWREDGKYFGHLHSYTPKVAAILQMAHEESVDPVARGARIQEMMVQLMCLDAELVFPGPKVPIKYVFPAPGRYVVFLEVAPEATPRVFKFGLEVTAAPLESATMVGRASHPPIASIP